ncbi:AAA family ATPase [Paenibacillus paridis]|uniref:AAA family ATPase n=1 Tax=Paenibacillus paridis TaxID=2583376 RepID=UPI00111E30D1|nr:AAA family ATPase [Paenibacillus paridis]
MSYLIKSLLVEDKKYNFSSDAREDDRYISNLSKINIFVGSNNSGKSSLMRSMFISKEIHFKPARVDLVKTNKVIKDLKALIARMMIDFNIVDYDNIKSNIEKMVEISNFSNGVNAYGDFYRMMDELINLKDQRVVTTTSGAFYRYEELNKSLNSVGGEYKQQMDSIFGEETQMYLFKKVYIPTLRGLRSFGDTEDPFLKRTIDDYFEQNDHWDVFTGLGLYSHLKRLLLGGMREREVVSKFQNFLSKNFFDGEEVVLIPSINSDVVHVKIGNEKEQPIYKLGDGIQSIIIITFPVFEIMDKPALIFIEEPELYLHPGMQRKLMETLSTFDNLQFFITTHSNHFLDITLDLQNISIYKFAKKLVTGYSDEREMEANFDIENVSNEDSSVLEMLGVKNSSVFLSNCTIWVEGITDRYYIRKYLELYHKSLNLPEKDWFKEDYHYSFVEYSGNNITHWSFLDDNEPEQEGTFRSMNADRLCSKLFLITDKDSEVKLARQQKLSQRLQERYYCLDCKEIENLLSKQTLEKIIIEYENVEQPKFKKTFTEATYKDEYLGAFIDDILVNRRRVASYGMASGTINNKVAFCEKALKNICQYDDMSDGAKELVKRVYEFIRNNNE